MLYIHYARYNTNRKCTWHIHFGFSWCSYLLDSTTSEYIASNNNINCSCCCHLWYGIRFSHMQLDKIYNHFNVKMAFFKLITNEKSRFFIRIYRTNGKNMPTAPSPRRSPIQVLTGLNIAWLQWSDENWYVQCDMAVAEKYTKIATI